MKWLSGGLTFVNAATVSALIIGMLARGLGKGSAWLSLIIGLIAAFAAFVATHDPVETAKKETKKTVWWWFVTVCFAIFAIRSFGWLLYVEGDKFKIQSPNNLGDLGLHITYLRNFATGVPLWPENPIYFLSSVRYPAGIDLFNALLYLIHIDLRLGLTWVGLLASLAIFYAFWRWGGSFAIAGFLFNGGIAGFQILQTREWKDYQTVPTIAWKSIPLAMLVTQRGLLYAIPVGLLLLYQWRAKFFATNQAEKRPPPLPFWIECTLYATMPLFHLHTFLALSIALGVWFIVSNNDTRKQLLLLVGCSVIPATFLVWLITDHFHAGSVIHWKLGWVQPATFGNEFAMPFFKFWFVNFGLWLPLVLLLIGWLIWKATNDEPNFPLRLPASLSFVLPAALIFFLACMFKFAPWEWDNTKIMIWAYFMILPFLWRDLIVRWPQPVRVAACVILFGSGFVSLFGGLAAPGFDFATRSEIDSVANGLRKIPAVARFAAYPTYNHPLLLNGRRVVAGYPGHLWTQGFEDYGKVNDKLALLMNGAPNWLELAGELKARYLFWGREEKMNYPSSTRPWEKTMTPISNGSWGAIYDLQPAPGADSPPAH